jgi:hypothetical protein
MKSFHMEITSPAQPIADTTEDYDAALSELSRRRQSSLQAKRRVRTRNTQPTPVKDDTQRCWICFEDVTESTGRWVKACHCSLIGHEICLLNWIDENQKGIVSKSVHCPQCKQEYRLIEHTSLLLVGMSTVDAAIRRSIPIISTIGLVGSVLVASTTFGAYAVMTMCGVERGERILGSPYPWGWRIWVGLPIIPFLLVLSRTKHVDALLPLIPLAILDTRNMHRMQWPLSVQQSLILLPWIRMLYNAGHRSLFGKLQKEWKHELEPYKQVQREDGQVEEEEEDDRLLTRKDLVRSVVGALLLPAISSMCGTLLSQFGWFRSRVSEPFHRNLIGGCLFLLFKDMCKLLYTYQRVKQRRSRRVCTVQD